MNSTKIKVNLFETKNIKLLFKNIKYDWSLIVVKGSKSIYEPIESVFYYISLNFSIHRIYTHILLNILLLKTNFICHWFLVLFIILLVVFISYYWHCLMLMITNLLTIWFNFFFLHYSSNQMCTDLVKKINNH